MSTTDTARRCIAAGDVAQALNVLARRYEWNGDQMICRCCKRALHFSRDGETFVHGLNRVGRPCDNSEDGNPWAVFAEAMGAPSRLNVNSLYAAADMAEARALELRVNREDISATATQELDRLAARIRNMGSLIGMTRFLSPLPITENSRPTPTDEVKS